MTLHFSPKALKDIEALPAADAARMQASLTKLTALEHAGRFAEMAGQVGCDVTKLVDGGYRLRQGNYRALLTVEGEAVTVERIRNRRDAYG